jgi:hypothetical protein
MFKNSIKLYLSSIYLKTTRLMWRLYGEKNKRFHTKYKFDQGSINRRKLILKRGSRKWRENSVKVSTAWCLWCGRWAIKYGCTGFCETKLNWIIWVLKEILLRNFIEHLIFYFKLCIPFKKNLSLKDGGSTKCQLTTVSQLIRKYSVESDDRMIMNRDLGRGT